MYANASILFLSRYAERPDYKGRLNPDGQTLSAKNKFNIAKVKNQYTMWGFAPAEPEAQAFRLWWMVGLR